ncbi:MAG: LPXTG cell wall anchor domain-containing protein [Mogibacterium sp.]|uniref:SHIRT domain-containing protein n=1 Tax=Mogibacterium sp. TaxID=2049035 RepID=UPI001A5A94D6|nr:SHIRT domain-containing protein [Mogibacterium sp.]MBL6468499.1 LPXTG cell wall anchor domain-containing protein [Mogibacterium sp.]
MKKRTAILILTLVMIFCFVPMSTAAADSTVIRVSTQEEFNKAITRVNEDSDSEYTIELTDDFSITGFSINSPHKATILGNSHTLTMPVGGSVHVGKGAELTLGAADGNVLNIRSAEGTSEEPGMLHIQGTCNMYSGVTLSGSVRNNNFGGGVTVFGGTFHMYGGTIEKCGIKGGSVCYGGGVAVVYGGQFIMDSGTIKDCYAESDYLDYWDPNTCFTAMGGGVFVSYGSYFRMNGGSISNNRATNMGGGVAVAISYNEINSGGFGTLKSSAEILEGKVEENQAKKGAGLFASGYYYAYANAIGASTPAAGATKNPGLHIKDTQILNNTATDTEEGRGGGVLVVALKSPAAASLENTTVKGNKAATGAGIASYESWTNLSIKGCTVTENTARKYGGGFSTESNTGGGKTTITDTVLCNNIADTAGSDVYLKKSPLVLPSAASMDSLYLGAPEDVRNQKIDGWYEDKTNSRYTEQTKAERKEYTGYANIDGSEEVALIAAANPSLVKIKFTNEDGSLVYKESFYPLGTTAKDIILPDATKASDEKYDYIFKGWSPAIKDATEDAVYTAVFEKAFKQFKVQYEFKSLTAGTELPEEVTALLPKDPAGYGRDTDIKAIAPAKTQVKVDGGTWNFKGFDKDSMKASMENADDAGNVKFTGSWEFTPKDPDPLPSTGGMGTHLFIIGGAALMAAAAIALVRNSKNSNKTK